MTTKSVSNITASISVIEAELPTIRTPAVAAQVECLLELFRQSLEAVEEMTGDVPLGQFGQENDGCAHIEFKRDGKVLGFGVECDPMKSFYYFLSKDQKNQLMDTPLVHLDADQLATNFLNLSR